MDYRREIDGLRALAVLPVILFHAGFEAFSGGFVGVDVFFVISGYLITTIILAELEQGKFSIVSFYERRARRILPALFLVMIVCIPFAWFWLLPSDMKGFSQSLIAVSVFASNILFGRETGYFDTAAELKPLLHTWSLAVEEQYYVLFPIFLMFTWHLGKRWILILLVIAGIASLALAQWASVAKPTAAFYLLPTRGWELLIGAFAAFYLSKADRIEFRRDVGELGGWVGLLLILYSIFAYSKATLFPGFYALVPTVGTVLIILFATQQTTVGKFIGNKVLVGIGLISYSAYLWHQPLFAFARHSSLSSPSKLVFSILSIASLALAYFSWRYGEVPFRCKARFTRARIFSLAVGGSFLFILLGLYGNAKNGFLEVADESSRSSNIVTNVNFIVLGDSHGDDLRNGLREVTSGYVRNFTSSGCIPFRNVDRYDYRFAKGSCARAINSFLDKLSQSDPSAYILLSSMGPVYLDGTPFIKTTDERVIGLGVELITDKSIIDRWKVFEIGLRNTLNELAQLKNAKVIFIIDIPELGIDYGCKSQSKVLHIGPFQVTDYVKQKRSNRDNCHVSKVEYDKRTLRYKSLVREVVSDFPNVLIFDPTQYFCDDFKCKGYDLDYGFLYRDVDHLSRAGSIFYANKLIEFLRTRQ